MTPSALRIAVTAGEPAGIGPDIVLELSKFDWPVELVIVTDRAQFEARATSLGIPVSLNTYQADAPVQKTSAGALTVESIAAAIDAEAGRLDPANAEYVIETLNRAGSACAAGEFAALVTAPVHKGAINDAGFPFTGHTEHLSQLTGAALPVMLLVADELRIALATTHLALSEVSAQITPERIESVCRILDSGLKTQFGIAAPRIAVLGLNPHAGEDGHLGTEDRDVLVPTLVRLREQGLDIDGPLPADTAFIPDRLRGIDATLAMYHDQGLPVLKFAGFGHSVNVTLGLPIIRTSVDHGTALDLAGSGRADAGSLVEAVKLAIAIAERART